MTSEKSLPSLGEISCALRRREISPVELARIHLDHAEAVNRDLNCLISISHDDALGAARRAETEIMKGDYRGVLHGIPFTAKDIFASAGTRTTAGSRILADWIPNDDAALIRQLKEAGAILIAKNNLSEFAAGPTNSNEHFGPARNPWNRDRIPGGSSGGSAGAVVAGIGFFSLGTDTGGSVRIPASLTGSVGLKPTYGRMSRRGVIPLSESLDTVGVLACNTADAAELYSILCGDTLTRDRHGERLDSRDSFAGTVVGLPQELLEENCDPDIKASFHAAVRLLEANGAEVKEVSIPWSSRTPAIVNLITLVESAAFHREHFRGYAMAYGKHLRNQILAGSVIDAADYVRALRARRAIIRLSEELFRAIDILALPTVAIAAPPVGAMHDFSTLAALRLYTRFASCTGQPALSIPSGFDSDGMPIGLQLVAGHGKERDLLQVGMLYERARGWSLPRPPLSYRSRKINAGMAHDRHGELP